MLLLLDEDGLLRGLSGVLVLGLTWGFPDIKVPYWGPFSKGILLFWGGLSEGSLILGNPHTLGRRWPKTWHPPGLQVFGRRGLVTKVVPGLGFLLQRLPETGSRLQMLGRAGRPKREDSKCLQHVKGPLN